MHPRKPRAAGARWYRHQLVPTRGEVSGGFSDVLGIIKPHACQVKKESGKLADALSYPRGLMRDSGGSCAGTFNSARSRDNSRSSSFYVSAYSFSP